MVDTDVIAGSRLSRGRNGSTGSGGSGRRVRSIASSALWLVLGMVLCIVIWELVVVIGGLKPVTLPSPWDVAVRTWHLRANGSVCAALRTFVTVISGRG